MYLKELWIICGKDGSTRTVPLHELAQISMEHT